MLTKEIELPSIVDLEKCKSTKRLNPVIGIYKITSPTGKVYIGLSGDIENRLFRYKKCDCKTQRYLYRSLKKHGVKKHVFEIIHMCELEELEALEAHYGKLFNVTDKDFGLNIRPCGGKRVPVSEETKKILSKLHSGKGNPFYKKTHSPENLKIMLEASTNRSPESRKRQGEAMSGEKNPFYKKKHTKSARKKQSKAAKKRTNRTKVIHTAVTKQILKEKALKRFENKENHPCYNKSPKKKTRNKISKTLKNKDWGGKHPNKDRPKSEKERVRLSELAKTRTGEKNPFYKKNHTIKTKNIISKVQSVKVNQYTLDGKFIKTWKSIVAVEKKLGISASAISKACVGKHKTSGGFIWKYAK